MPDVPQPGPTVGVSAALVRTTLEELGSALTAGDARKVATFWDVPALVLADEGGRAVSGPDEVEAFFQQSIAWYRQQGTPTARPELKRWEPLSDRVISVDVEWLALDERGVEKARDASHYIMRMGDDRKLRVHVAMSRRLTRKRRDPSA